jgi:hypothetical protein
MPLDQNILSLQTTYDCNVANVLSDITPTLSDHQLLQATQETRMCTHDKAMMIASTASTPHNPSITKEHLAKFWGIGPHTASQTLKVTTKGHKECRASDHAPIRN